MLGLRNDIGSNSCRTPSSLVTTISWSGQHVDSAIESKSTFFGGDIRIAGPAILLREECSLSMGQRRQFLHSADAIELRNAKQGRSRQRLFAGRGRSPRYALRQHLRWNAVISRVDGSGYLPLAHNKPTASSGRTRFLSHTRAGRISQSRGSASPQYTIFLAQCQCGTQRCRSSIPCCLYLYPQYVTALWRNTISFADSVAGAAPCERLTMRRVPATRGQSCITPALNCAISASASPCRAPQCESAAWLRTTCSADTQRCPWPSRLQLRQHVAHHPLRDGIHRHPLSSLNAEIVGEFNAGSTESTAGRFVFST